MNTINHAVDRNFSIGNGATASSTSNDSIAIGKNSLASGLGSTAIGSDDGYGTTQATGEASIAVGPESVATGLLSTAVGALALSYGDNATAIGNNSYASGYGAVCVGGSTASGDGSAAISANFATASGTNANAFGSSTEASGTNSTVMGSNVKANGNYTFAIGLTNAGTQAILNGTNAFAILQQNQASRTLNVSNSVMMLGTSTLIVDPSTGGGSGASITAARSQVDFSRCFDALIVPKGTTAQRPATGIQGMFRWNTTTNLNEFFDGTNWINYVTGAAGATGNIQYRNSTGGFAGSNNLEWDATNNRLGINTATPGSILQVNSINTTDQAVILAGMSQGGANDATNGVSLRLGYNSTGNRQLWLGDSAQANVSTNTSFRYVVGFNIPLIDAISNDGNTRRHVGIGSDTTNVAIGPNIGTQTQTDISSKLHVFAEASKVGVTVKGAVSQASRMLDVTANGGSDGGLFTVTAAGNVGIGNNTPATSLDMGSKNDAMIVPKGATAFRPATGQNGMFRYNTGNNRFEGYISGSWQTIAPIAQYWQNDNIIDSNRITPVTYRPITANFSSTYELPPLISLGSSAYGVNAFETYDTDTLDPSVFISYDRKVTTTGADLTMEQTGDTLGPSRLIMQGRNGSGGALFQFDNYDVVDFGFQGSSRAQYNLRFEHRSFYTSPQNSDGEMQFIANPTSGSPSYYFNAGIGALWMPTANIGLGTNNPNSAIDASAKTTAISLPSGTAAQRPTGVNGMERYNTDIGVIERYESGAWNSRLSSPGVLASVSGINAKTTGANALYTVPTGKTAIITGILLRVTAASAITAGPSSSVTNSAGATIATNTSNANLQTTADVFMFTQSGASKSTAAGGVISLNINAAATGTSETISCELIGYLV